MTTSDPLSDTPPNASGVTSPPPRRRWRRCRRALWIVLSLVVLLAVGLWAVSAWIDAVCIAVPPPLAGPEPIQQKTVSTSDSVQRIDESWLTRRSGIMQMLLRGDAYTLGYANAALTGPYLAQQEDEFLDRVKGFLPTFYQQFVVWKLAQLRTRDLPKYLTLDEKLELLGLAEGYPDPHPDLARWAPLYYRVLNYHAAHDLSHAMIDHPMVDHPTNGCTSFAAWGDFTTDGHLIIGRNFDFNAARAFDLNKIITRYEPEGGIGFVAVTWPGMMGVVTGVNDEGIAIAVNGVQSDDQGQIGTPIALVIRRALSQARTLDQAVTIIRDSKVFVSDLYLVADGKIGRAVVVEKTPVHSQVRQPDGSHIICANHFMTPALADHKRNQRLMADGTTVDRYNRMKTLVDAQRGRINPQIAVTILRDRRGPDDLDIGLGNEAALNPLIATHSVVIDLTAKVIWVSAGPHQLGEFVPFSVDHFAQSLPASQIFPADSLMNHGDFARFETSMVMIRKAHQFIASGHDRQAVDLLYQAISLNGRFYLPYLLLGRLADRQGHVNDARRFFEQAHQRYPAFGTEKREVNKRLGLSQSGGNSSDTSISQ